MEVKRDGGIVFAFLCAVVIHAGMAFYSLPGRAPYAEIEKRRRGTLEISFVSAYKERTPEPVKKAALPEKKETPVKTETMRKPVRMDKVQEKVEPVRELQSDEAADETPSKRAETTAEETVIPAVPSFRENPAPRYPRLARRRGYEGVVILAVDVRADGMVEKVTLKESSGYAVLDTAACEAVKKWKFRPATRLGIPIAMRVDVPIRFEIEGT